MRWLAALLFFACADQAGPGPQSTASPSQAERNTGHVRGRVVDATESPVAGATVSSNHGISTHSDEYGHYLLVLAPGEYEISVAAPGFQTPSSVTLGVDGGMVYIRNWLLQRE